MRAGGMFAMLYNLGQGKPQDVLQFLENLPLVSCHQHQSELSVPRCPEVDRLRDRLLRGVFKSLDLR